MSGDDRTDQRQRRSAEGSSSGSGIEPKTGEWAPAFEGQRRPLEPGNEVAVKHGAYALVRLTPRAAELADAIRALVGPMYRESDELAVGTLALVTARIEAATAALEKVDERTEGSELAAYTADSAPALQRLREDLRGWINTQRRLMNDLGLTPAARYKFGLDVARTRQAMTATSLPDTDAEADELAEGET